MLASAPASYPLGAQGGRRQRGGPENVVMRIAQIWMSSSALKSVLDAAASKERIEPCGALLGFRVPLGAEVLEAVRLKNAHPSPDRAFLLQPESILEAGRVAR